jgi:protein SCO1/2
MKQTYLDAFMYAFVTGVLSKTVMFGVAALGGAANLAAEEATPPMLPPQAAILGKVGFAQRLNSQVPVDLHFTNDHGENVTLADCMQARPTVFVLAYYRCPMLCNQVLNGVARTLQAIDFEPGKEFEVVVVSFDPTDTVELAAAKKDAVVHAFDHDGDGDGWHFLVGDEKAVKKIADSVGFQYQYDAATQQYAHASGVVLLTPAGRVSRYFYGIDYPTRDVRLGLVEASEGRIGSRVDELLLYCFHYDPLTGRYGLAIIRVIRAGGVATVLAIVCFIGVSLRRERKQRVKSSENRHSEPFGGPQDKLREESGTTLDPSLRSE